MNYYYSSYINPYTEFSLLYTIILLSPYISYIINVIFTTQFLHYLLFHLYPLSTLIIQQVCSSLPHINLAIIFTSFPGHLFPTYLSSHTVLSFSYFLYLNFIPFSYFFFHLSKHFLLSLFPLFLSISFFFFVRFSCFYQLYIHTRFFTLF